MRIKLIKYVFFYFTTNYINSKFIIFNCMKVNLFIDCKNKESLNRFLLHIIYLVSLFLKHVFKILSSFETLFLVMI